MTHAAPRSRLYEYLPMFKGKTRRWTEQRAHELLDVRLGPALIGVHIDYVVDLGTHHGVHFQAVPVAHGVFGGPAECASKYDPATASPSPDVCLVWWPDRRTATRIARNCSASMFLLDGTELSTIPLGESRMLVAWILPVGKSRATVIPRGSERRGGRTPIKFTRVAGQLHLAVTSQWPDKSFDYQYVENGKVVRQPGPRHR